MLAAVGPVSLGTAALGTTAVAALFALHHLRTRPTRRAVATLIFWRETAREQQSRILWARRFTHRRTFLLLSVIALMLAASLSADRWDRPGTEDAVVAVVDVGSPMAATVVGGQSILQRAVASVRAEAKPSSSSPMLIAAGAQPAVLCELDAPLPIFMDRLARITPSAEASNAALSLELAASALGDRPGRIDWYTVRVSLPDGLPPEVADRVRLRRCPAPSEAVAITGVTFKPAADQPSLGTLCVRLAGASDRPVTVRATIGGVVRERRVEAIDDRTVVAIGGVEADGQVISIEVRDAPGSPTEHAVRYALPKRTPLRFCVIGDVPRPLRAVLGAIGTQTTTADGAIIVAAQGQALPPGGRAAIVVTGGSPTGVAGRPIVAVSDAPPTIVAIDFEGATANAEPSLPPAVRPVLVAGPATVAGFEQTDDGPRLYLSSALIDEAADMPRRAAFPVLMQRLCAKLAGWHAAAPVVAAQRVAQDPLWPSPPSTPPTELTVTKVFDPPVTAPPGGAAALPRVTPHAMAWRWTPALLIGSLLLLAVEGFLLASKRIV